jgi:N-acetylmuramoyl-L-alanine amidase
VHDGPVLVNTEVKIVRRENCRLACAFAIVLLLTSLPALAADKTPPQSARDAAEAQFDRAQSQRAVLEATPEPHRLLIQYQDLVKSFRRVYLLSASAKDVPLAIMTVGDLNRKMGDLFDPKFYQSAIEAYEYLQREYPASRYKEDALLAEGQIQNEDLRDAALAQKTFEKFLQLHPRSQHAAEVRAELAKIKSGNQVAKKNVAPVQSASAPPATVSTAPPAQTAVQKPVRNAPNTNVPNTNDSAPPAQLISTQALTQVMEPPTPGRIAELRDIKTWTTPDYTRIVINLDAPVKYQAARVGNPERIYFDLSQAHLSRGAIGSATEIHGDLLKNIRAGQNKDSIVRVVLEVGHIKDYSVFLLRDPYRMVIDVYAKPDPFAATTTAKNSAQAQNPKTQDSSKKPANSRDVAAKTETPHETPIISQPSTPLSGRHEPAQEQAADEALAADIAKRESLAGQPSFTTTTASNAKIPSGAFGYGPSGPNAPPATDSKSTTPAPSKANYLKGGHGSGSKVAPAPSPSLPRDGQQSLSRALGLKVGRIVIDAGHGGHDTGTIGPNGLMEKDLCLDVALRLGKMIEEGLPGAEVIYTRSDDTFIPLEERTNIANQAKADLFISIHANSSPDSSARGVETYYLNFSPSPEAMAVAARENATAQNNVRDLESLVQRIARNEKIEESRELASDIQESLARRLQRTNKSIRDRGVRKAPFVVLIGANMPSVLAEISFISNPADEVALAKPDGREHVAEGLYKGIEAYLQSTNSLAANQTKPLPNGTSSALAHSGNQR